MRFFYFFSPVDRNILYVKWTFIKNLFSKVWVKRCFIFSWQMKVFLKFIVFRCFPLPFFPKSPPLFSSPITAVNLFNLNNNGCKIFQGKKVKMKNFQHAHECFNIYFCFWLCFISVYRIMTISYIYLLTPICLWRPLKGLEIKILTPSALYQLIYHFF